MHFSDGHEGLIEHLGNVNKIVPREKLMSIDMLIIQLSSIAAKLMSSSFWRKCVSTCHCLGVGTAIAFGVVARLRLIACTSVPQWCAGTNSACWPKCRVCGEFAPAWSPLYMPKLTKHEHQAARGAEKRQGLAPIISQLQGVDRWRDMTHPRSGPSLRYAHSTSTSRSPASAVTLVFYAMRVP